MQALRGVHNILSTPFREDGELDEQSLRRLTDATIDIRIDGMTILVVAGETHKLRGEERRPVVNIVMETNAGRVPVIVSTSREGTEAIIEACQEAEAAGAAGFMIAPPTFVQA